MPGGMDRRQSFLQLMASMHDPVDLELFSHFIDDEEEPEDERTSTRNSSCHSESEQPPHRPHDMEGANVDAEPAIPVNDEFSDNPPSDYNVHDSGHSSVSATSKRSAFTVQSIYFRPRISLSTQLDTAVKYRMSFLNK
uniref:Uncharacterized protein n=1 Tax=Oryza punctata TaxID=4537 RepID=A0A0E0JNK3_ORYPU